MNSWFVYGLLISVISTLDFVRAQPTADTFGADFLQEIFGPNFDLGPDPAAAKPDPQPPVGTSLGNAPEMHHQAGGQTHRQPTDPGFPYDMGTGQKPGGPNSILDPFNAQPDRTNKVMNEPLNMDYPVDHNQGTRNRGTLDPLNMLGPNLRDRNNPRQDMRRGPHDRMGNRQRGGRGGQGRDPWDPRGTRDPRGHRDSRRHRDQRGHMDPRGNRGGHRGDPRRDHRDRGRGGRRHQGRPNRRQGGRRGWSRRV